MLVLTLMIFDRSKGQTQQRKKNTEDKNFEHKNSLMSSSNNGYYQLVPGTNWTNYDIKTKQISGKQEMYGVPGILG